MVLDSNNVVRDYAIGSTGSSPSHVYGVRTECSDSGSCDAFGVWGRGRNVKLVMLCHITGVCDPSGRPQGYVSLFSIS